MAVERFLTLWHVDEPEKALKIRLIGDKSVIDQMQEWASEDVMFTGTIDHTPMVDPDIVPLFAQAAFYPPSPRIELGTPT